MKYINKVKKTFVILLLIAALFSCTEHPNNVVKTDRLPAIFPDYIGVTIPVEVAPLNFNIVSLDGEDIEAVEVSVKGSKADEIVSNGKYASFDIEEWHSLLAANKGGKLTLRVSVKADGQWTEYKPFDIYVSDKPLEQYGLTYRRIQPGFEVYSKMGIYQRNLSNFDETAILENTQVPGMCINCHTANRTDPAQTTFHVRGDHGATMVSRNGNVEWLKAKNDSLKGSMVYPYWHPGGRYCAYSTNKTSQSFHSSKTERIEVFDQSSDVFVYDTETHEIVLDSLLATPDHYETYPVFSPDGRTMYFCSSKAEPIPARYREIRYDICSIAFNPDKGQFGNKVDTLFRASALKKSATHPRPSYDGRFIMFTMADYGCFPIWHKEADNWILDLKTGKAMPVKEANSNEADSWHNWSSNSHWVVFTSRRGDGLHTRLYISYVDENGTLSKPFLLPQLNPWEYYDSMLDSFNTPDFISCPVDFNNRIAGNSILSDKRIETKIR